MNVKKYAFFLCLVVVIYFALMISAVYIHTGAYEDFQTDVIVVLGASQWNGVPSPVFKARLDTAFLLFEGGVAENIIVTGGVGDGDTISEAQAGSDYLIGLGVVGEDIILEDEGRTTMQSLRSVMEIMSVQNFSKATMVSDGFHIMRLKKMSADLGINANFVATQENIMSDFSEFKYVLRELAVFPLYILFGI